MKPVFDEAILNRVRSNDDPGLLGFVLLEGIPKGSRTYPTTPHKASAENRSQIGLCGRAGSVYRSWLCKALRGLISVSSKTELGADGYRIAVILDDDVRPLHRAHANAVIF